MITRFTYGTTRLGDPAIPFERRVEVARYAMSTGVWFHSSHTYGNALEVLRAAYDQDRSQVPPTIFKIGWDSADQVRSVIHENIDPLGIPSMAIGQLCLGGKLAEEVSRGEQFDALNALKAEGLVGSFVLECWPWNSEIVLKTFREADPLKLVDGVIFYLNPLQRLVSNELWDLFLEAKVPIYALRSVGGGDISSLKERETYIGSRARQIAPLYARSGCESWTEFCVRYVYGFPTVHTTIGATSHEANLDLLIHSAASASPLDSGIHGELLSIQREWADSFDRHAEIWSM